MRRLNIEHVFSLIKSERDYQGEKHGDAPHEVGTWLLLIEDELREAKQALIKGGRGRDSVSHELIQVAALCCAAIEQHGMIEREGRAI